MKQQQRACAKWVAEAAEAVQEVKIAAVEQEVKIAAVEQGVTMGNLEPLDAANYPVGVARRQQLHLRARFGCGVGVEGWRLRCGG